MGYSLTVRSGTKKYDFNDVLGHSIGNSGAVQVRETDGSITVIGSFDLLTVNLTEEEKAEFRRQVKEEEARVAAEQAAKEAAAKKAAQQLFPAPVDAAPAELDVVDEVEGYDDVEEEPISAEEFEELADDAEEVAESARAAAKELRDSEVKH